MAAIAISSATDTAVVPAHTAAVVGAPAEAVTAASIDTAAIPSATIAPIISAPDPAHTAAEVAALTEAKPALRETRDALDLDLLDERLARRQLRQRGYRGCISAGSEQDYPQKCKYFYQRFSLLVALET